MFKPTLAGWAATRRSRQLILRLFPAICALLLLIGLSGYLLVQNALNQDRDVQQRSRTFISRTLDQVRNEVARNIINYAKWGEAYKHLHMTVDKTWADEQRNVGPIPYELYGYNGVLVIDPKDQTRYAVIDGKPSMMQASDWLEGDLSALVADTRLSTQENDGLVRAFKVGGVPALVAAATISPASDPMIEPVPGPMSVMMFVTILDPAKLTHLSDTYGLPTISVSSGPREGYDQMPLLGSTIELGWVPPKPGMDLLQKTLPLFISGVLVLAVVLAMLVRYALTSARQIDDQLEALHASQRELSSSEQRFRQLSLHDSLTGLSNRLRLHQFLDEHLGRASPTPLTVLSLDLDRFKPINDSLGHAAGDRMLKDMAARLLECVAEDDTVARMGGDEFTLLLQPGATQQAALTRAIHVAEQILASLVKPFVLEGREFFVTASIGIALSPQDGNELSQLMKNADTAMYHAKERGKNNFQFYQADMNASALERLELESDLRHALEQEEFTLYYQPQFSGDGKRLTGAEALLRWRHPRRGLVPPGDFIPVIEELGLVVEVGEWVLKEACQQLREWHKAKVRVPKVSVNISARQFSDGQLAMRIANILQETGLPPACLELELTESILMREVSEAMLILDGLKRLGLSIAVDDFGTGYSSLNYLKQFPIDVLKIDRTFVDGLPSGEQDAQIARAIIAMAHSLNLAVIAEGVETHEQLEFLREHGCDEVQGYLFGRPMPASRFEAQFSNDALFMID
mgnify:CR=1 FL=1